jgi:hypothetical protein
MRTSLWLITFLSISISGCGASLPIKPVTDPTLRFEINGARFGPPSGAGWSYMQHHTQYPNSVVFYKETELMTHEERAKSGHSYYTLVQVMPADEMVFNNAQELGVYLDDNFRKDHIGSTRFRFLQSTWEEDDTFDAICVRWHTSQEDFDAPQYPNKLLILDGTTIVCVHPLSSEHIVIVLWSDRRLKGDLAWDFSTEVETLLQSVEFTPVRK